MDKMEKVYHEASNSVTNIKYLARFVHPRLQKMVAYCREHAGEEIASEKQYEFMYDCMEQLENEADKLMRLIEEYDRFCEMH